MFRRSKAEEGEPADEINDRGVRWNEEVGAGSEGGSKEVRIVPIDAIIVSLYLISLLLSPSEDPKEGDAYRTYTQC